MFRNRLFNTLKAVSMSFLRKNSVVVRYYTPVTCGLLTTVYCEDGEEKTQDDILTKKFTWDDVPVDNLEHEFLIRQATTVNVNAATQLLTVTLVAFQDTSERLRDALSKEICLVRQVVEWGDKGTPDQHWDQLVAVRGSLCDLNHNIRTLMSYMDYAEKLAKVAAEISYLSGNIAASDAICERIEHANRTCNIQKQLTHDLQKESLQLQQEAIINSQQLEDRLKNIPNEKKKPRGTPAIPTP